MDTKKKLDELDLNREFQNLLNFDNDAQGNECKENAYDCDSSSSSDKSSEDNHERNERGSSSGNNISLPREPLERLLQKECHAKGETNHKSRLELSPYYVTLPYPTTELINFEYVGCELGNILRKHVKIFSNDLDTSKLCKDVERLIIIHDGKEAVNQFCLRYFDAEPDIEHCTWKEASESELPATSMIYICVLGRILKNTKREALESILEETLNHVDMDKIDFILSTTTSYEIRCTKAKLELIAEKSKLRTSSIFIFNESDIQGKKLLINRFYKKRKKLTEYLIQRLNFCTLTKLEETKNTCCAIVLKRLKELRQVLEEVKVDVIPYDCNAVAKEVQRIGANKILSFSLSGLNIQLYVQHKFTEKSDSDRSIIDKISAAFPELIITTIRRRRRKHFQITPHNQPGETIYSEFNIPLGTLGMFGHLGENQFIAVTSPHVIEKGQKAIIRKENDFVKLGECIWSPKRGFNEKFSSIDDIAVINVLDRKVIRFRDNREIKIYDGTVNLENRRVFKYGATTNRTEGRVCKSQYNQFMTEAGKSVCFIIVQEVHGKSNFSERGDSGAVVLTKDGTKYVAIGMVYGGINIPELPENMTAAIRLDDAIDRFKDATGQTLSFSSF